MTADRNFICSSEVYVIAHVPIGYLPYAINTTAVRESYHEQLVKIFHNYSDFVKAQFYGHTHRDSILVHSFKKKKNLKESKLKKNLIKQNILEYVLQ